jgi:hypothetical protein
MTDFPGQLAALFPMKNKTSRNLILNKPSEDDIRAYAYHLYCQNHYQPGQDLANWFEAIACLNANIPHHHLETRLHYRLQTEAAANTGRTTN